MTPEEIAQLENLARALAERGGAQEAGQSAVLMALLVAVEFHKADVLAVMTVPFMAYARGISQRRN